MSEKLELSFELNPNFRRTLTAEQHLMLEEIERLGELDPEVSARLSRALDRLQRTQPYQQLEPRRPLKPATTEPGPAELSEAERAAREEFISQELSSLLLVAGRLNQTLETQRHRAQADHYFRDRLRAEFK